MNQILDIVVFEVSFKGDDLSITLPQSMLFDTNAAMLKFRLVTIIRDAVECGKVSFVEVHEPRGVATDNQDKFFCSETQMLELLVQQDRY